MDAAPDFRQRGSVSLQRAIVFYDGDCGVCHGFARFLVARDARHAFDLAPLFGETHAKLVSPSLRETAPDSVQVLTPDGRLLVRSRAVAAVLAKLPAPHPVAAWLVALTPRWIADAIYDAIARRRASLAARPSAACPLVPEPLRGRFLP